MNQRLILSRSLTFFFMLIKYALSSSMRPASWNMVIDSSVNLASFTFSFSNTRDSFNFAFYNFISSNFHASAIPSSPSGLRSSIFLQSLAQSNSILSLCTPRRVCTSHSSSPLFFPQLLQGLPFGGEDVRPCSRNFAYCVVTPDTFLIHLLPIICSAMPSCISPRKSLSWVSWSL